MKERLNEQADYPGAIFFISASSEKISLAKTIADIMILSYIHLNSSWWEIYIYTNANYDSENEHISKITKYSSV